MASSRPQSMDIDRAQQHDQQHLYPAPPAILPQQPEDPPFIPPYPNRFSTFGDFQAPPSSTASPRGSTYQPYSENNSATLLADHDRAEDYSSSRAASYAEGATGTQGGFYQYNEKGRRKASIWRRPWLWIALLAALLIVAAAVIVPIYFKVIKPNNKSASSTSGSPTQTTKAPKPSSTPKPGSNAAITGGDGSLVTASNGSTFTYSNKFGGYFQIKVANGIVDFGMMCRLFNFSGYYDPEDPFNDSAAPNSWTPPLNTTWDWLKYSANGVNLGGWFVLEPFITPALFQKYQNLSFVVEDEWTLSQAMAADTSAGGGLQAQLEDHYNTFITEDDIAQIAGAGLNWVRVPIPFWAIEKWDGEPFLDKVCWKYILRLFEWARKYGLRVNLDLHTIPGSQNGYNHSGKSGQVNFMNGVMGIANAQRALDYIRIIVEFISQPQYSNVVPMFGIVNEALVSQIGQDQITAFYLQAHNMIRSITGTGAGNGPYISIHDGFQADSTWANFLPGSDRIILDTHPYFAFSGQPNTEPVADWAAQPCNGWAAGILASQSAFGVTVAGEFSNGYNDCGLFLRGVTDPHTYPGNCATDWEDASLWSDATKQGIMQFAMASMDSLHHWFFWTWKIAPSATTGKDNSPLWSYKAGLEGGWMPTDPRTATGTCAKLGNAAPAFAGPYSSWQTGGAGAGTIAASASAQFPWPPASLNGGGAPASLAYTYTQTGPIPTLPPPTLTLTGAAASKTAGVNGWKDPQDTVGDYVTVAGCTYPNAWDATGAALPAAQCTGTPTTKKGTRAPEARVDPKTTPSAVRL
ncbi:glycoside hydrolase [Rickenella mellea]|uniref:glucan 1,3-beta-glucosidase n=1 Tax=Rickenella mellea TaxID=50990 RepID=A0A4Y7Q7R5_9AGAM|nr:glycoside hydrolase [Rickenella mellea]